MCFAHVFEFVPLVWFTEEVPKLELSLTTQTRPHKHENREGYLLIDSPSRLFLYQPPKNESRSMNSRPSSGLDALTLTVPMLTVLLLSPPRFATD